MKNKKVNSKDWHFDFVPVTKEESDKIKERVKDGIPSNMFVICGNRILTNDNEVSRHET